MIQFCTLSLLFIFLACQPVKKPQADCAGFVNPFIGTGGERGVRVGNMFPGAAYLFGTIKLSPYNGGHGWMYCGGYRYANNHIVVFLHDREKASPKKIYSKSICLNGKLLDRLYVTWDEIRAVGTIEFEMTTKQPNRL